MSQNTPVLPRIASLVEVKANGGKIPARSLDAFSTRTVYAGSVSGVVLDCDPSTNAKIGGGTPTNNTTALTSAVSAASGTAPVSVHLDGFAAINALVLPNSGHVAIQGHGWDTGVFSLPGTNDCTIRKADSPLNPFDPWTVSAPAPTQAGSVILSRLKVDGGRGTYPNGNVSTLGSGWGASGQLGAGTDGPIYPAIDLFNLTGAVLDQVWVHDPCVFHARFGNSKNIFISNSRFESPGRGSNTDGVHFSGGNSDIHIVNVHCETGDDAIALNSEEGYHGTITRACIANVTLDDCWTAIRVDGFTQPVSKVVASNLVGSVQRFGVIYGTTTGTSPVGNNESLRLANCDLSIDVSIDPTAYVGVYGSGNSIELDGVTWTHPLAAVSWFHWGMPVTVDNISIRGKLVRNTAGNAAAYLFDMAQGTCGLLRIEDYTVVDQAGSSYAAIPYLLNLSGSASVGRIWIGSLDGTHHTAFTNDFTKIGSIAGPGVLASGFAFPDSAIANNTTYRSSTQSALCYKDGTGTVYPFTLGSPVLPTGSVHALALSAAANAGSGDPLGAASAAGFQAGAGSFSVGCFVKMATLPTNPAMMVDKTTAEYALYFQNGSPNKFNFLGTDNAANVFVASSATVPTTATWYFVVGVYDHGANTASIYVNGVLDGGPTAVVGTATASGAAGFQLGGTAENVLWGLTGDLAMAFKFSSALTGTLITWLYNGGLGRSTAEILAHAGLTTPDFLYGFDGSTPFGTDSSANALTLTSVNATAPTQTTGPG